MAAREPAKREAEAMLATWAAFDWMDERLIDALAASIEETEAEDCYRMHGQDCMHGGCIPRERLSAARRRRSEVVSALREDET